MGIRAITGKSRVDRIFPRSDATVGKLQPTRIEYKYGNTTTVEYSTIDPDRVLGMENLTLRLPYAESRVA